MSIKRLFVEKKKGFDIEAEELKSDLVENLGLSGLTGVRVINRYDIDGISDEELQKVLPSVYAEPQVDNVEFENIEIVKNPPSKEELKEMYEISGYELKKFFNTSGVKYRELGLKDIVKTESDEKLLDILSSDGMLIKRPIAYDGKNVVIGFKVDEWKEKLL